MAGEETLNAQSGENTAQAANNNAPMNSEVPAVEESSIKEGATGEAQGGDEAKAAEFADVQDTSKPNGQRSLEFILDIPLQVSVELGRTKIMINDLLKLGQGSVIELSKLAGEPMEVLINQKLLARGEVVVVNEKFGVRLTDVISPLERVKQLK
jgi:flagellar motor switch protein FliN/FliY